MATTTATKYAGKLVLLADGYRVRLDGTTTVYVGMLCYVGFYIDGPKKGKKALVSRGLVATQCAG